MGCDLGVNLVIDARTDLYLNRIGDPASIGPANGCAPTSTPAGTASSFQASRTKTPYGASSRRCTSPGTFWPLLAHRRSCVFGNSALLRVSVGSALARAAAGITSRIAQELKTSGSYDTMLQVAIPYSLSRLFEK